MTTSTTVQPRQNRSLTRGPLVAVAALALAVGFAGGRAHLAASSPDPAPAVQPLPASVGAPVGAALPGSYSAIVDKVAPAVVTVRVEKRAEAMPTSLPDPFGDFFGQNMRPMPRRQAGLGSGVIVSPDGRIITNHHVIDSADQIRVDLADGRSFKGKLIGSDEASDLAVIHIDATGLPTVPLGDSDAVKVGDVVLAFGNPLGVGQTVTMGIVSATGRATGVGDGSYEDFLQTDAAINQGNSGGPLVNLKGELVGINSQILSPSGGNIGLGFAIPSTMARAVADQLVKDGIVHRSKLGVTVQSVTPDLAASLGLEQARGGLVSGVEPDSPAAQAGVKQGDVIVAVDGRPVVDSNALRNMISGTHPGTTVSVDVMRDGTRRTLSAKLVELSPSADDQGDSPRPGRNGDAALGLRLEPLTPGLSDQLELPRNTKGLVVTDVDPSGTAASAGIRRGDVIQQVDGQSVDTIGELRSALASRGTKPALVLINRRGANLFLALPEAQS